ncbi:MAG: helix-turn-helix transcriptional regulator [Candidatus Lokiarchaeota archaeon]|nr:helix-turn-helix transcriptional regulator [Candidatus Lokiarchaeota archaeon]
MSNQDNEEYILNHRAFVLLGLVAELPSYAYNINQRIEERGMRDWTNIGKSSIYNIITKLEEDGLVESYIEEVDNRIRKIYTITDYGSEILRNKAYNVISEFIGKNDEDFYVAFSMLPILTKKQQIDAITKSLKKIKTHQRELEKMLEEISHMPLNVRGLFVHPIKILGTDIEFLEWALKEIQKGGEKES